MTALHKYGVTIHMAWLGCLIVSITLLVLAACVHGNPAQPSRAANPDISSKVSPLLKNAAQQLASGSSPSDFTTRGPVRADAQGRLQVYVHISSLSPDNVTMLVKYGLVDPLPSPALHLVQGWVKPQDLNQLASLAFVTRITPPNYGQPR